MSHQKQTPGNKVYHRGRAETVYQQGCPSCSRQHFKVNVFCLCFTFCWAQSSNISYACALNNIILCCCRQNMQTICGRKKLESVAKQVKCACWYNRGTTIRHERKKTFFHPNPSLGTYWTVTFLPDLCHQAVIPMGLCTAPSLFIKSWTTWLWQLGQVKQLLVLKEWMHTWSTIGVRSCIHHTL